MGIRVKRGLKEAIESLKKLPEQAARQAEKTLKEGLTALLPEINEGTPVKTGYLLSRNQVIVKQKGLEVRGEFTNDASYALAVHERPSEEGPGGKFIERVVNRHAQEVGEALGRDQVKMLKKLEGEVHQ